MVKGEERLTAHVGCVLISASAKYNRRQIEGITFHKYLLKNVHCWPFFLCLCYMTYHIQ